MGQENVAVFTAYPFEVGDRIRIEDSVRGGDWEVVGMDERTVVLRCPVSGRQFSWSRFCYHVRDESGVEWPKKE